MAEVFLASSALKKSGHDGLDTIKEAERHNFDGVQLYIDERYHKSQYLIEVSTRLAKSGLGLVVHLPNIPTQLDLNAADYLARVYPNSRTLIHYLPATELPSLDNTRVGWENSIVGIQNNEHIREVFDRSYADDTFFVFDIGRSLYANDDDLISQVNVINFIRDTMLELNPLNDLIHCADKRTWSGNFRDVMCVLGQGVCGLLLDDLRDFYGTIVLEHEDLQMAVDSLSVLKQ